MVARSRHEATPARRLRGGFVLVLRHKGYQATERSFSALKLPGKTTDPYPLVKHLVNHASSVFYVEDAMGKHSVVHHLQVFLWPDFLKWFAQFLGTLQREIRAH